MRFVSLPTPNGSIVHVNADKVLYVAQAEDQDAGLVDGVTIVVLDCGHDMSWLRVAGDPADVVALLGG